MTDGWAGAGWFFLLIPLFWILLVVALVAIFGPRWRRNWQDRGRAAQQWQAGADVRGAEKTLAERFAQGDIDEVEFRARLEVLRANRSDSTPGT